jgi:UDP-N-acetylmuramoyl-L-alanyl-D-glutamate--2,6-diaminopimelate ligase
LNRLSQILIGVEVAKIIGNTESIIGSVQFDSRKIVSTDVFIAIKGTKSDGHAYIDYVISCGVKAVVCEYLPNETIQGVTYIIVKNSGRALGIMASNLYGIPSSKLILVGVTGTNGKTTTATLLYEVFQKLGYKSGLLSTILNKVGDRKVDATHTTPDPLQLNNLLNQMVNASCNFCFMEVSSHAIEQERIAGLIFKGGIFTNLTHDHLDYHGTIENYLKTKKKFFDQLSAEAFALTNIDDKNGRIMIQNTKAIKKTYSLKSDSDFKCRITENHFEGLQLNIDGEDFWSNLIGKFNAYNLLAVYAASILLGEKKTEVLAALSTIKSVEGRFDCIRSENNIIGIVDYAHTPDALNNVLNTIAAIRTRNEILITVIGAGGDRDKLKRPLMGKIASEKSDRVILTSDNPRSENPEDIVKEMEGGIDPIHSKKVLSIINRKEAIKTACALAKPGDIILIAGKGHEKYQEIRGEKYPFDDKELLKGYLLTNINNN